MNANLDLRWKQRFVHYDQSFGNLSELIQLSQTRSLSKYEDAGLIQYFEISFDLAWKLLKDYLEAQGFVDIVGSKSAIRKAFQNNLIPNGEIWMVMVEARNLTSHVYSQEAAIAISEKIKVSFYSELQMLYQQFSRLLEA